MQAFAHFILIYSQNCYVLVCVSNAGLYISSRLCTHWGKAFISVFLGCVVSYTSKTF